VKNKNLLVTEMYTTATISDMVYI